MLEIGQGKELTEKEYKEIERVCVWMSSFGVMLILYSVFY